MTEYKSQPVCVRVVDDHQTRDTDWCVRFAVNTED